MVDEKIKFKNYFKIFDNNKKIQNIFEKLYDLNDRTLIKYDIWKLYPTNLNNESNNKI